MWSIVNVDENKDGYTALAMAVRHDQVDIMARPLNGIHDFDKRDKSGNTFLHLAAQYGLLEIAKILLPITMYIASLNEHNSTPVDLAIIFDHGQVAELIFN